MNREDFPMLKKDYIYFDNGATTYKPQCVIDAINDYYINYSSIQCENVLKNFFKNYHS